MNHGSPKSHQVRQEAAELPSLLPCPFCGNAPRLYPAIRGYRAFIECETCGIGGPDFYDIQNNDSAIEASLCWNRRATGDQP